MLHQWNSESPSPSWNVNDVLQVPQARGSKQKDNIKDGSSTALKTVCNTGWVLQPWSKGAAVPTCNLARFMGF